MRLVIAIALTFAMSGFTLAATLNNKSSAVSGLVKSTRFGTAVEVSRIVDLVKLVSRPDLQANITVKDLGGTTDVTPTQELFFTLYTKGDTYSTDATFNLGAIYDFKSARKISDGVFEILAGGIDFETSMPKNKLLIISAQKAMTDILNVKCTKVDCPASDDFESTIFVSEK